MGTKQIRAALAIVMAVSFASGAASAKSSERDDWEAARKASCPELADAHKTTVAAERKVVAAIKEPKDGTVAGNVLGVATLAIFGIGFFSWDENVSAEENLADLRYDLKIITTVASEKKCRLPEVQ